MKTSYSYIWFPLTSYYEVENDEISFKVSDKISPYLELNDETFNDLIGSKIIELNPYYRFTNEVHHILTPENYEEDSNLIEKFLNINFHLLGELDLYVGQCKKDIYVKEIIKGIEKGDLGEFAKENLKYFKPYEKHMIADVLYEMYNHLSSINAFKNIIKLIYPDSIFYDKVSSEKNMILYLNYKKDENEIKLEVLKVLFFPLGLDIDIFWEKHFGVVDYSVVMKIGEIAIY